MNKNINPTNPTNGILHDNDRKSHSYFYSTSTIVEPRGLVGQVALFSGIAGFLLGVLPIVGWFFWPLWIVAVITGLLGLKDKSTRAFSVTALALVSITLILKISFWLIIYLLLT